LNINNYILIVIVNVDKFCQYQNIISSINSELIRIPEDQITTAIQLLLKTNHIFETAEKCYRSTSTDFIELIFKPIFC
jgi:hypothetical protein